MKKVGLVSIKNRNGHYLQASESGRLLARQEHRDQEETWYLIEIDKDSHVYALQNWNNGKFMSKRVNGCAPAINTLLTRSEEWVLVSGRPYGIENGVAFQSAADKTFLTAAGPGKNDTVCGGEVSAKETTGPGTNAAWEGWWVIEPAKAPAPSKDSWNTMGKELGNVAEKVLPALIETLLAA